MVAERLAGPSRVIGRYALFDAIASGGMATVHLGRSHGAVGFARTVAIKRLHESYARDRDFIAMFVDEARLASRIHHPNVVQTLDVVEGEGELFLVMEYVHGETLARLIRLAVEQGEPIEPAVVVTVLSGALMGLHAAHETRDEHGRSQGIVHRDVSPHNILVGADGSARVLDFGVARAAGRIHKSQSGIVKGKVAYLPPELANGGVLDRTADIYAAAVVAWEALAGRRLFRGDNARSTFVQVLRGQVPPPSAVRPEIPATFDRVILKALARDPQQRYPTAERFAEALQRCLPPATPARVGAWVQRIARPQLARRSALIAEIERRTECFELDELRAIVDDFATGSWATSEIRAEGGEGMPESNRMPKSSVPRSGTADNSEPAPVARPVAAPADAVQAPSTPDPPSPGVERSAQGSRSPGRLLLVLGGVLIAAAVGVLLALATGPAPDPANAPSAAGTDPARLPRENAPRRARPAPGPVAATVKAAGEKEESGSSSAAQAGGPSDPTASGEPAASKETPRTDRSGPAEPPVSPFADLGGRL